MNKSYFSDDEESQNELILYLLNNLYDLFTPKKLSNLTDIIDESLIRSLIFEIEPLYEIMAGPLEITASDNNFGIRYANIVMIINSLDKYFKSKSETEKILLTDKFKFKENIVVNNLIKGYLPELIFFCEMFFVVTSISSAKDIYLDRLSLIEEKYVNGFLNIVEKYIIIDEPQNVTSDAMQRKFTTRTSILYGFTDQSKTFQAIDKLRRRIEELEEDKSNLLKSIKEQELKQDEWHAKMNELIIRNKELELKEKDYLRESERIKNDYLVKIKAHDDLLENSVNLHFLENQLNQKENEIEEIKKNHQFEIKNLYDKIHQSELKIQDFHEKELQYQIIQNESEKLKTKIKELSGLKEKFSDYEEIQRQLNEIKALNENLKNEKLLYEKKMNELNNSIIQEREHY